MSWATLAGQKGCAWATITMALRWRNRRARAIDWLLANAEAGESVLGAGSGLDSRWRRQPLELVQKYAGRCPHIHAKDLAPAGENEDQMGLLMWATGRWTGMRCCRPARAAGAEYYIVEHDLPKDPVASIRRSREFLASRSD